MSSETHTKRILILGQTPPPFHGQAMMTQRLLEANLEGVELYHVRLNFSKSIGSIGKFSFYKILHLIEVIAKSIYLRFRHNISVLYFMPVGNSKVPLIRDILILSTLRILFPKTYFHFRAAGISLFVKKQTGLIGKLAHWVYRNPDVSIQLAARNPEDGAYFGSKKVLVIPNGLEDAAFSYLPIRKPGLGPTEILFVGVVRESKGILILLEAAKQLQEKGLEFKVNIMGGFESPKFEKICQVFVKTFELEQKVEFLDVKINQEKWNYFRRSHILCFPSFFESESFGNVVLEAMMFEMPVVGSNWRGIPEIIADGKTGLVVPTKDAAATANALQKLIENPVLRVKMGKAGRDRFIKYYRLPTFIHRMDTVFKENPDPALIKESEKVSLPQHF